MTKIVGTVEDNGVRITVYPYFRLSVRVRSARGLEQWFQFLSSKGISCCIVKRVYRQYYLFREGKEHTVQGLVWGSEPLYGEIIKKFDKKGIFKSG